jgi:hypothetical protein
METTMKRLTLISLLALLIIVSPLQAQETAKQFGDYVIHYNAVSTDFLTPEVARNYGIQRSKNRVLLTVSVLRGKIGVAGEPVAAKVKAHTSNLNDQTKKLNMREVRDGSAIYYIDTFSVSNEETIDMHISATPKDGGPDMNVKFRRQFFTK